MLADFVNQRCDGSLFGHRRVFLAPLGIGRDEQHDLLPRVIDKQTRSAPRFPIRQSSGANRNFRSLPVPGMTGAACGSCMIANCNAAKSWSARPSVRSHASVKARSSTKCSKFSGCTAFLDGQLPRTPLLYYLGVVFQSRPRSKRVSAFTLPPLRAPPIPRSAVRAGLSVRRPAWPGPRSRSAARVRG